MDEWMIDVVWGVGEDRDRTSTLSPNMRGSRKSIGWRTTITHDEHEFQFN